MISQRIRGLRNALLVCQCALAAALFCLCVAVFVAIGGIDLEFLTHYAVYCGLFLVGVVLEAFDRDKAPRRTALFQQDLVSRHQIALRQAVFSILLVTFYLAVFKDAFISRFFMLAYSALFYLLLLWTNYRLPTILARRFFRKEHADKTLLIGSAAHAERLRDWLVRKAAYGIEVVGILCDEKPAGDVHGLPCLGYSDEVEAVVAAKGVTQVILLELPTLRNVHMHLVSVLERLGVRLLILNDLEEKLSHPVVDVEDDGLHFITLRREPLENPVNRGFKRLLDITVATLVLIFVFPFTSLVVWLVQRRQSPGPLFFKQPRAGIQNHEFTILKYRSMRPNNHDDDPARQASQNDERVFRAGRWIRRFSIDEIPQFWNVLKGDMSVVGPRPHLMEHNRQFARLMGNYHVRTFVKPGVTGLAQIWGFRGQAKSPEDIANRLKADITYLENWTFALDCIIIITSAWHMIAPPKTAY